MNQCVAGQTEALTDMLKYGSYNYNALCYIPSEIAYGAATTLTTSYVDSYLGYWGSWYGGIAKVNKAINSLYKYGQMSDGDKVRLGDDEITVLSTPGHTSGSVCYHYGDILICGDTLFSSGYGRYDLPTGDPKVLFNSLKLLAAMQGNPVIYPGHGTSCRLSDALVIKELRKRQQFDKPSVIKRQKMNHAIYVQQMRRVEE
jgi:glyoxylase-like metal-dependent hydrolase (beta-lactamase superfamily II)